LIVAAAGLINLAATVADAVIQQMIWSALVRACTSVLPVNATINTGSCPAFDRIYLHIDSAKTRLAGFTAGTAHETTGHTKTVGTAQSCLALRISDVAKFIKPSIAAFIGAIIARVVVRVRTALLAERTFRFIRAAF
jgi:hypothetical protein